MDAVQSDSATLWECVAGLSGKTLRTLRGKTFDVSSVTPTEVVVVPLSTGKPRPIRREEIEQAHALGIEPTRLIAKEVRDAGASEVNPAYVVAILKAIQPQEKSAA
jgi:hypothetical protein